MDYEIFSDEDREFNQKDMNRFRDSRIKELVGKDRPGCSSPRIDAPPALSEISGPNIVLNSEMNGNTANNGNQTVHTTTNRSSSGAKGVEQSHSGGTSRHSIGKDKTLLTHINLKAVNDTHSLPKWFIKIEDDDAVTNQSPEPVVVAPIGYPDVVIQDDLKRNIITYLNVGIKARSLRRDDIEVDKILHRSGVMIIKASTELSASWMKLMISRYRSDEPELRLQTYDEAGFNFAPGYTAWVPDEKATFERLTAKVRKFNIKTESWRFVRLIEEKSKPGVTGKKFMFIAMGNIFGFLDAKKELRFNYDAYQQRAVIKATRPSEKGYKRGKKNCHTPKYLDFTINIYFFADIKMKNLGHLATYKKLKKRKTFSMLGWRNKEDSHNFNHTTHREFRLNLHHKLRYILNYLYTFLSGKMNNKRNIMNLNAIENKYYCTNVLNLNYDFFQQEYRGSGVAEKKKNLMTQKLNMFLLKILLAFSVLSMRMWIKFNEKNQRIKTEFTLQIMSHFEIFRIIPP